MGKFILVIINKFFFGKVIVFFYNDCYGDFFLFLVIVVDNFYICDFWVVENYVFDFGWVDIFVFGDDYIFFFVCNCDKVVGIYCC